MSSAYSQRSRSAVVANTPEEQEPKQRRPRGTSDFVQVKLSRKVYGPLKIIASLTGKTAPELLEEIVTNGLETYNNLTINDLIQK